MQSGRRALRHRPPPGSPRQSAPSRQMTSAAAAPSPWKPRPDALRSSSGQTYGQAQPRADPKIRDRICPLTPRIGRRDQNIAYGWIALRALQLRAAASDAWDDASHGAGGKFAPMVAERIGRTNFNLKGRCLDSAVGRPVALRLLSFQGGWSHRAYNACSGQGISHRLRHSTK